MVTTEELIRQYSPKQTSMSGGDIDIDNLVKETVQNSFATTRPVEEKKPLVNRLFAGEKIGEAIGTFVANRQLTPEAREQFGKMEGPSAGEVIGDVGRAILEVAGFKGAGIGKTVLSTVAKGSALGAGLGATSAMADGGGVKETIEGGVLGGASGAIVSGAVAGVGELAKNLSKAMPKRLIQSALRQSKKELGAGKDLTPYVLERAKVGTTNSLLRESSKVIDEVDNKINKILSKNEYKVLGKDAFEVGSGLFGVVRDNPIITSQQLTAPEVLRTVLKTAPQARSLISQKALTLSDVNKLRIILDKSLGGNAFLTPKLANNKEITKAVSNGLRELVKTKAPATRKLFDTFSKEIRLTDALEGVQSLRGKNSIISMGDLIGGGLGATAGIGGAVAGIATRRVIESTLTKTASAVAIDRIGKALTPILQKLEPAIQTEIIQALGQAFQDVAQQKQSTEADQ